MPEAAELLLDASVFIAAEAGRPLARRPRGQARVSVVTLAELRLGVLRSDGELRELREATLSSARRFVPLAVTEPGGTVVEVALTPEQASIPLFGILSEGQHIAGACAFSDET